VNSLKYVGSTTAGDSGTTKKGFLRAEARHAGAEFENDAVTRQLFLGTTGVDVLTQIIRA
jgi:hypothetical protein